MSYRFIILVLVFQVFILKSLCAQTPPVIPFRLQQEEGSEKLSKNDLRDFVEARLFEKTNEWRITKKLNSLEASSVLLEAGRDYSADMLQRNYFSHYSPEGKMVLNRIQKLKPGFDADCGENLHQIYSPTGLKDPRAIADQMLEDWAHSPSHRKNLSAKNFSFMAIGCANSHNRIYCTQIFSAPGL